MIRETETHEAVFATSTLFKGNLLSWWQTKLQQAPNERQRYAGFAGLSALSKAILDAFFTRDRQVDAHDAFVGLRQGSKSLIDYHKKMLDVV